MFIKSKHQIVETQVCREELKQDDETDALYWEGFCEGDKDGSRLNDGQSLVMAADAEVFPVGSIVIVYQRICSECLRDAVLVDYEYWLCPECDEGTILNLQSE